MIVDLDKLVEIVSWLTHNLQRKALEGHDALQHSKNPNKQEGVRRRISLTLFSYNIDRNLFFFFFQVKHIIIFSCCVIR